MLTAISSHRLLWSISHVTVMRSSSISWDMHILISIGCVDDGGSCDLLAELSDGGPVLILALLIQRILFKIRSVDYLLHTNRESQLVNARIKPQTIRMFFFYLILRHSIAQNKVQTFRMTPLLFTRYLIWPTICSLWIHQLIGIIKHFSWQIVVVENLRSFCD